MVSLNRLINAAGIAFEKVSVLELNLTRATRDGLTGLYNHREFQTLLKQAMARSLRQKMPGEGGVTNVKELEKHPLALVLCDIDFFKKLNDNYGHRFGDKVLKEISRILDKGVREGIDYASRYGGEEFTLILNDTPENGAFETANRIRKTIEDSVFITDETKEQVKVTMSFGISMFDKDAKVQEQLIEKADRALYKAKEHGRNRVEFFGSGGASSK